MGNAAAPAAQREGYTSVPGIAPPEVPFDQASHVVFEEGPSWTKIALSGENQILKQEPLPANGFLRNHWYRLETEKAGEEVAGKAAENFPFNIISRLEFFDQGGHTISNMTGFNWFLADLFGGYFINPNMAELSTFSKTLKEPNFTIVVPCEITPTGFGALTNMTEATKYQVQPTINKEVGGTGIYSEKMTKNPELKLKCWVELWILPQAFTQPEPGFPKGRPQQQRPPLEGTIQAWTEQANIKVVAGEQPVLFTRMGQMLRNHIIVTYESKGEKREAGVLPEVLQILWSRVMFRSIQKSLVQDYALAHLPNSQGVVSGKWHTGVYPLQYSFGQGRFAGGNSQNTLLPSVNSTRYELKGEFKEGLITILTNDVAIAATSESARREVPGMSATESRGVE